MSIQKLVLIIFIFIAGFSCNDVDYNLDISENYSNEIILEWNLIALEAMGGEGYPLPLLNSRINAMMHIAMHDALNSIVPTYETYGFEGGVFKANPIAAISSAAYEILLVHFPDQEAFLLEKLNENTHDISNEKMKEDGIELGKLAAQAILDLRKDDGAFADPLGTVDFSETPGVYQPVSPFEFAYAPFWKNIKPFALESPQQLRVIENPALKSEKYLIDYNEVKSIGSLNSSTRTEEETFIAKFWYELAEMGWNKIAREVAKEKNLSLIETARLFALLDIALADAYIAGWDGKYHYNFWRPRTAIRTTDDGIEGTVADSTWEPLLPTPPVPDYPSTHSALGNAGAKILASVFGDETSFSFYSSSADAGSPKRSFSSFSQAANENANSRILVGAHFRTACDFGQAMGDQIGDFVLENLLQKI